MRFTIGQRVQHRDWVLRSPATMLIPEPDLSGHVVLLGPQGEYLVTPEHILIPHEETTPCP